MESVLIISENAVLIFRILLSFHRYRLLSLAQVVVQNS